MGGMNWEYYVIRYLHGMWCDIVLFESGLKFVINIYYKLISWEVRKWNYIKCSVKQEKAKKERKNKQIISKMNRKELQCSTY